MAEFNEWYYDTDQKVYCFCLNMNTIGGWFGWEARKLKKSEEYELVEDSFSHPSKWSDIYLIRSEPDFIDHYHHEKMIRDIYNA